MEITRRDFLKAATATLWFLAGCKSVQKRLIKQVSKGDTIEIKGTKWEVKAVNQTGNFLYLIQNTHIEEDINRDFKTLEALVKAKKVGAFLCENLIAQEGNTPFSRADLPEQFPKDIENLLMENKIGIFGTQVEETYEKGIKAIYSALVKKTYDSYLGLLSQIRIADIDTTLLSIRKNIGLNDIFKRKYTASAFKRRFDARFRKFEEYLESLIDENYNIPTEEDTKAIIYGEREDLLGVALVSALNYSRNIVVIYGEGHTENFVRKFKDQFTILASIQPEIPLPENVFCNKKIKIESRLIELGDFSEEVFEFGERFLEEYEKALEYYDKLKNK